MPKLRTKPKNRERLIYSKLQCTIRPKRNNVISRSRKRSHIKFDNETYQLVNDQNLKYLPSDKQIRERWSQHQDNNSAVIMRHRNDILHSFKDDSQVVTIEVDENADLNANECPYLAVGFF